MDGATRQKAEFPTFSFPGTACLSRVVLDLRRIETKFQRMKVGWLVDGVQWSASETANSASYRHRAPPTDHAALLTGVLTCGVT